MSKKPKARGSDVKSLDDVHGSPPRPVGTIRSDYGAVCKTFDGRSPVCQQRAWSSSLAQKPWRPGNAFTLNQSTSLELGQCRLVASKNLRIEAGTSLYST